MKVSEISKERRKEIEEMLADFSNEIQLDFLNTDHPGGFIKLRYEIDEFMDDYVIWATNSEETSELYSVLIFENMQGMIRIKWVYTRPYWRRNKCMTTVFESLFDICPIHQYQYLLAATWCTDAGREFLNQIHKDELARYQDDVLGKTEGV